MIINENITINGKVFVRTFSDAGYQIRQDGTGDIYDEAVDPAEIGRTYTETDIPIERHIFDETEEKARAYDILMGEGK